MPSAAEYRLAMKLNSCSIAFRLCQNSKRLLCESHIQLLHASRTQPLSNRTSSCSVRFSMRPTNRLLLHGCRRRHEYFSTSMTTRSFTSNGSATLKTADGPVPQGDPSTNSHEDPRKVCVPLAGRRPNETRGSNLDKVNHREVKSETSAHRGCSLL